MPIFLSVTVKELSAIGEKFQSPFVKRNVNGIRGNRDGSINAQISLKANRGISTMHDLRKRQVNAVRQSGRGVKLFNNEIILKKKKKRLWRPKTHQGPQNHEDNHQNSAF